MPPTLRDELRQQKPFPSLEEEVFLNIARTEAVLRNRFEQLLAPHGVSLTQYNVLRILRGAGPNGLCRNEIRQRLVSRMPDVTRLLDRMEAAGLVTRLRSTEDRRLVSTQLTARGRDLVDSLDAPTGDEHRRSLSHLSKDQLRTLAALLTRVRHAG